MAEAKNVYTLCETVVDVNGKKHKVYPVPIGYIQDVAYFLSKVNPDLIFTAFMMSDFDMEDGAPIVRRLDNGHISYGQSMIDELVDIVEIGLRFKEKKEDIRKWLDVGLAQQIIEIMIGISQVKKRQEQMKTPTGTD